MVDIDELTGIALDAAIDEMIFNREVLGTVGVYYDPDSFHHFMIPYEYYADVNREGVILRPVYLDQCMCDFKDESEVDYFGHISGCLSVSRPYSEVIQIAWKVVEKLRQQGYGISASDYLDGEYCFSFYPGKTINEFKADGDTMPLAICRAALKAAASRHAGG